jgi:hypothetical protein
MMMLRPVQKRRTEPLFALSHFSFFLRSEWYKRTFRTVAPSLLSLCFASLAHAQGTISFSGAQTFMQTVQTFAEYAGAVICLIGLIFAGVSFMSGNIQRGVIGLFGAIFGAGVLGWGAGWISSLTGQSVS